jgi:hypothetical protein
MDVLKFILSIMFVVSILCTNAQTKAIKTDSLTKNTTELMRTVKFDSAAIRARLLKLKGIESVEVDSNCQIVLVRFDKNVESVLEEINKNCKKVNASLVEYVKPVVVPVVVEVFNFNPKIDKFLNTEDSTIFFDEKFMNLSDYQIHPRSKEYYLLIQNIYNLKKLLYEVAMLPISQRPKAKEELSKALTIINTIKDTNECYKSSLFEEQKQFYRNLVDKFNQLYQDIYN